MRHRGRGAIAIVVLLVGALSGCAAAVQPSDLTGTYTDEDGLKPLVLDANGACTAHLLPASSIVVTGTCRWSIRRHDGNQVRLDFHRDPSAGAYFVDYQIDGSGPGAKLYQVTDPDTQDRYVLHR